MEAKIKLLKREPDAFAVDYAKELLKRIESGETTGIIAIEQKGDGFNYYTCGGIEDRWKALGYLTRMIYKLNSEE